MTPEQLLIVSQMLKRLQRAGVRSIDSKIADALKRMPMRQPAISTGSKPIAGKSNVQVNQSSNQPTSSPIAKPAASKPTAIPQPVAEKPVAENSAARTAASKGEPIVIGNQAWNTESLPTSGRESALAELQNRAMACTQCAALQSRKSVVFGEGAPDSRVAFFGEAPDENEDTQGKPFVGEAGDLLDKIILAAKLSRDQIYILNSVKCRPLGKRNPSDQEIDNCRPFFAQQLEIVQPDYIVCWGTTAAKAILGYTGALGKIRGTFHRYYGAKVMVTYHPAYLLRDQRAKHKTWEDIQMLMKEMGIA